MSEELADKKSAGNSKVEAEAEKLEDLKPLGLSASEVKTGPEAVLEKGKVEGGEVSTASDNLSADEWVAAQLNEQAAEEGEPARPNYLVFGFAAVVVLILAVVAMIFLTGADVSETPPPASLSQVETEGKTLFVNNNCTNCHPAEGRAGGTGPRLSTSRISDDKMRSNIRRGIGSMPGNARLTDDEINKIIGYIRAIKPPPATPK